MNRFFLSIILLLAVALSAIAQSTQIPIQIEGKQAQPVPRKTPSDEFVMVERARRAEMMGDFPRALVIYKEILNRTPWQPNAIESNR